MEEKVRVKRPHRLNMEDRKRIDFTGITDVVSFDPVKVVLESDYGHITIKGEGLHVNRLSVEKGELDLDGRVDSVCYSEAGMKNKRYRELAAILVMMTMTVGSITTVAAETEITADGVLLAWIYDNIRAFRRIVRHKTVVFMSVEDIIYGIYAGLSVFVMCFKVADGIIRGFIIMGIAVGAFLYFKFLSSFYIRWSVRIIKILLKPACFILKNVVRIITIPVRSLKMYMKRRKDMGKKEAQG